MKKIFVAIILVLISTECNAQQIFVSINANKENKFAFESGKLLLDILNEKMNITMVPEAGIKGLIINLDSKDFILAIQYIHGNLKYNTKPYIIKNPTLGMCIVNTVGEFEKCSEKIINEVKRNKK